MNIINEVKWLIKKVKCLLKNTEDIINCGITDTLENGHLIAKYACETEIKETITSLNEENGIVTYINEDNQETIFNIKFSTLVENEDGTYTLTTDDGNSIIIDNNNNSNGISQITDTLQNGHLIAKHYDGISIYTDINETITSLSINNNTLYYNNENGETDIIVLPQNAISEITNTKSGNLIATHNNGLNTYVDINETITSIIDNNNNSFSYINEEENTITINTGTISEISNTLQDGNLIGTHNNNNGIIKNLYETITTLISNNNGIYTYTSEDGTISTINVKNDETKTTFTDLISGNLIGKYHNEEETIYNIKETITTLIDNGNNTYTYTSEDNTQTLIDINETNTSFTDLLTNGNLIGKYHNEENNIYDIKETITTLIDNNDGTYIYTSEDNTQTLIDINETNTNFTDLLVNGNLIGKYHNEEETIYDIKETITTLIDNNDGTYTYTSEDNTQTLINIDETNTIFTDLLTSGNLIGKYYNEESTIYNINETVTTLINNGNGVYTYTSEDGTTTSFNTNGNETETIFTNLISGNLIGIYTNETGNVYNINETVTTLINNNDGTYTYISENNTQTLIDTNETNTNFTDLLTNGNIIGKYHNEENTIYDILETITTLIDNNDNTFTYTSENNTQTTFSVKGVITSFYDLIVGKKIGTYVNEDGIVYDLNETITQLVDNGDGTYTYTNENGDITNITSGENIYISDGSLINERNVDLNNFNLNFINNGNIGINTNTPSRKADINGILRLRGEYSSSSDTTLFLVDNTNSPFLLKRNNNEDYGIGLGKLAGYNATNGENSLFFGVYAGQYSSGNNVYYFGKGAGKYAEGDFNIGIGNFSMRYNNKNHCIGLGYLSNESCKKDYTLSFGTNSGRLSDSLHGIFLGFSTGYGAKGDENIAIGKYSSFHLTGNNNLFLGSLSGHSSCENFNIGLGKRALIYNEKSNNIVLGNESFKNFFDDTANEKTFDASDVENDGHFVHIPNHNFGNVNEYVNLKFLQGSGTIYPLVNESVYKFRIVDNDNIYFYLDFFGSTLTGTGHKFVPQYKYENNIILGNYIEPYKDNTIILGDSTHENIYVQTKIGINRDTPKTNLEVQGGIALKTKEVSSDYNVLPDDYFILVNNSSGNTKTINLTKDNDLSEGRIIVIKDKNYAQGKPITIKAEGSYTIEGTSTIVLNVNKGHKTFILKGNTWYII